MLAAVAALRCGGRRGRPDRWRGRSRHAGQTAVQNGWEIRRSTDLPNESPVVCGSVHIRVQAPLLGFGNVVFVWLVDVDD